MTNHSSLHDAIKRSGQPLREIAGDLGVSAGHLHDLASGRRRPSFELAVALQQRFGLSLEGWASEAKRKVGRPVKSQKTVNERNEAGQ